MEVVSKALEKGLDLVVELAIRQLGYIVCYKNNVKELNDSVEKLGLAKENVRRKVEDAKRKGKEIDARVTPWLKKVEEKIIENERFQNDKGHKIGCSMGFLPYLWFRHQLGRKAKKALDFNSLLNEPDNFDVYEPDPTSMNAALSNVGYEDFESRTEIMERINAALEDSTVRMIGVYGPGGIGKTSLVKEVAKRAREEKLFNVVVMVTITRNPDPSKIQGEIADILGLKFEEASEIGRADRLRKRIRQEEENTLIILDDLWEGLDLNKLGIPFDDNDFSHEAGNDIQNFDYDMIKKEKSSGRSIVKILLTSRNEEVLSAQMDVKTESIFSIGFLKENEANKLFKKVAGVLNKDSKREKLTVEIVKKCGGLPMAIIAVGKALKNKTYTEWNEALEQLKREGITGVEKSMESSIKLSYDHLKSEELKSTFLLCAQMGPHSLITDLIKYSIGLCILQGVHTIKDADNRIGRLIKNLKDSGLLLDIDSNDYFSMHDMVRDAALSIASKEHNIFTLRNGKLDEWPDKDELERYATISLHHSDIIDGLPEGLNCPQLKVFHIDNDDSSMRIPDNFFEGMKKLRVLVLIGFHLSHLPPSIKCLTNLRMLCLERCVLGNLSIIGELKKLRILSLSDSDIEILPCELGQLCKLQLFDINNCSKLKVIPPNVLSSLTSLEELYMRNSLNLRQGEGETNNSQISLLDELRHLHQLRTLEICILNAEVYPRDLFFNKLDNYKIVIGDFKMLSAGDFKMPNKYEASRSLALQLKDDIDIHSQKGIKILFGRVKNLLLGELKGVRNALYELNLEGFPCLKHLSIINSFDIQYIINSDEFIHPQNVFPELESLCLYKLVNMEILCHNRLTNDSLRNLKTIKIQICSRLKNLFSFQLVKLLTKLETIEVSQCDSLEEIVVGELGGNADSNVEDYNIEFPQLQSLTLLSLPSFIGFYTNSEMLPMSQSTQRRVPNSELYEITTEDKHVTPSHCLFSERVDIPKIESLELSSINVHFIWSYQSLSSSWFQTLMKLNVNNCNKLTYLFSFSVAKNLVNLKGLSVSESEMMEEIFSPQEIIIDETEVVIFPKLEKIQFTRMERLSTIWPQNSSLGSFRNLDSMVIEQCEKLDIIFPPHMIGRIQNIIKLEVVNCKSVKEIFHFKDAQQTDEDGKETNFQDLFINFLPNLEHVWNRDTKGILNFKKLRSIKIQECPNLKHLLPVSVAKGLQKLETLAIFGCAGMKEVVYWEEGSETSSIPFVFPQVTSLYLVRLPKLTSFYRGRHTLEWQALKSLGLNCYKPEAFTIDTEQFQLVISKLEFIAAGLKEAEWLRHCIGNYRMHNLKQLRLFSLKNIDIVYWFLHRIPSLEYLGLFNCLFEEVLPHGSLVAQEKIGTVVQLKGLLLDDFPTLENLGLERDPSLRRIENLTLKRCPKLIEFAPCSASFTHLTYLNLSNCNRLRNLMACSTAKSLVQLTTMEVKNCKAMEEIVAEVGNAEETEVKIVFRKLRTLAFVALTNLTSFCSSKNHAFDFPSLEKLIVKDCPKMKIFTEGVLNAPNLQEVCAVEGEEEGKWYWDGDLNATIRKGFALMVSLQYSQYVNLVDYPELQQVWYGKVPAVDNCFRNLKTLVAWNCGFVPNVIPSHLLPYFNNLEELIVQSCYSIQAVFDINDLNVEKPVGIVSRLKKVTLEKLHNLEYVWSKDPRGVLSHQFLKELCVRECKSLKSLFPASVATDTIDVNNWEGSVEIGVNDETATGETKKLIMFPGVILLRLSNLPELECIYTGIHNLEWPKLKQLDVYHCDKLNMFPAKGQVHFPIDRQALVSVEEVITNLEALTLCKEDAMIIEQAQFQANLLHRVKFLKLQCFHNSSDIFPYEFLRKLPLPNIEKLGVSCSRFKEIFCSQRPHVDYHTEILSKLKELELGYLSELHSIGFEHPWVDPFPENIETLKVFECRRLVNLVSSTVSFSNLRDLTVSQCHEMAYLFTTSTAKSLSLLKHMSIKDCESMEDIVSDEREGPHQDEIIFSQLQTLYLDTLPNLRSFYGGSFPLNFPSLTKVSAIQCLAMRVFCQGDYIAPNLFEVNFRRDTIAVIWEGDLNTTLKLISFEYSEHLKFSKHSQLEQVWHGELSLPENCFRRLKTLVLENLEFLSEAVPSHLLSYLKNLEELQIRSCTSIEVIFNMKDMNITKGIAFHLKKLILDRLPRMEHVWNKDPQGALKFENLEDVHVTHCDGLKVLFTTSMAKNLVKLKKLIIETCEALVEIVGKEELCVHHCESLRSLFPTSVVTDTIDVNNWEGLVEIGAKDETGIEGETKKLITFPGVTLLRLRNLPELKCIYPGIYKLEWPELKQLDVYHCDKLKMFPAKGQVHFPIDRQALVSVEEVISNLEELSLSKEDTVIIQQGQFQANLLQTVKFLKLRCFHNSSDIFPYEFLQKVPLPNIESLRVSCSRFKEIFFSQRPHVDYHTEILSQLKGLELNYLPELHSIGFEHPWLDPFPENIETLKVFKCHRLTNLVSSTVSFLNLRDLTVSQCHEMAYLFTTSTAKSLSLLKNMSIKNCESIEEIVSDEREEPHQDEIIFSQLQTLYLDALPNLRSFYCGTFPLNFPSLTKVSTIQCPRMRVFCQGDYIATSLFAVNFQQDRQAVTWEGDLNTTLKKASVTMSTRNVKLSDHPELEEMWCGVVPVPDRSFINLKSLIVESCQFSSKVIPGHLIPFLSNLKELEVKNCDSVKVIFDVTNITRDRLVVNVVPPSPLPFSLKKLTLEKLPNLEHVWNKDPQGIVTLQTLQEMYVDECKGLKSLFPPRVPRDLVKLETLQVKDCEELVEIVTVDEEEAAKSFVLPCLTSLTLEELPELNYFYLGPHELKFPELKELHVRHCDKLKMFTSESESYQEAHPKDQVQPPLIFVEKAIPNVEELSLNGKDAMLSWHEELPERLLQNLKFLWLTCFHNVGKADSLPFEFLHKVPNIEKLGIVCSGFKQIFPPQTLECITIFAQLKELHLGGLPGLESIGLEHSWLHPLTETLENLRVYVCPKLTKLVQSAAFFSNLKELEISECHRLEYLFTSSTATGLVKLEEMSIEDCKSIKEVVLKERDESAEDEIIFERLKELSLRHLSSLVSFYNGNSTLKFPSLDTMITDQCPRMKIFSQGLINAPMLKKIQVSPKASHTRWEGDFKTTVDELFKEKVSFEYSEHLKLSKYSQLEQVWHGELSLPENCFRRLKILVMENLKFLSEAVPSHLLPYLKNLEELQVRSCTSVEVIFNIKDMKITKGIAFHLKKLTLDQLPSMKHVWNKDPQGVLRFENLQDVNVTDCEGLKVLFPTSVAKNVVKLKTLIIETCESMVEIVGKEDAVAGTTAKFEFPCLNSVTLSMMPELECFYSGKHNLQCPALKHLRVYHCGKLEIFTSEAHPEDHVGISIESQPLFIVQKVIQNLEELSLNEKETMMLWHGDYAANLLDRVICLQLYCFHNVKEGDTLPFRFLQKASNIETLAVACSDFEEIFPSQAVDLDVMSLLAQLKGLTIENLSKLNSIGLEHPQLDKLRENLKILEVCRCPRLTNLVQTPVSFPNLRELLLSKCDGLVYLFTSSTAKILVSLKKMSIEECQSIKEIVAKEGEESTHDEIIFEKLRELSLKSLSSLASFCTGNSVLKFPSLGEVIITQCPKMKIFSQGLISAPMLIAIQASLDEDDLLWEGDLNATVEKMFLEKAQRDFVDATEGE